MRYRALLFIKFLSWSAAALSEEKRSQIQKRKMHMDRKRKEMSEEKHGFRLLIKQWNLFLPFTLITQYLLSLVLPLAQGTGISQAKKREQPTFSILATMPDSNPQILPFI